MATTTSAASTYPRNALDDPSTLRVVVGSFWNEIGDNAELDGFLNGAASAWRRAIDRIDRARRAVAFDEIPLLEVVEWTPVLVLASKVATTKPIVFTEDGETYGGGSRFGDSVPTGFRIARIEFDSCEGVCDSPANTTIFLTRGAGYVVDNGSLVFDFNPFDSPEWTSQPVLDDSGNPIDRSLTIWLWRASRDDRLLQRRIGYALGMDLPSTDAARRTASAIVDCLTMGTSELSLRRVFAAVHDIPLCESDGETVEAIIQDSAGWVVVTNRHAYRCPSSANIVVAVGDALRAGDILCDAVTFDRLGPRVPPGLKALALPPGYAPACGRRGPSFSIAETPVRVTIPGIPL